jgi:DNA topoisomerase I
MILSAAEETLKDPVEAAHLVGLRYVTDRMPGIRRERSGQGFRYRYAIGEIVTDEAVLRRIKSLAIPPAWSNVWICPDPAGHLQATGRDDRGRKQSRYHPRWREVRDETKYARMIGFGMALPRIRRRVQKDLKLAGLPRDKVLATVVRLLEVSLIRVGNEEYARENDSFGLTTMRNRHVHVRGEKIRFHFQGKSGKWHEVDICDKRLARIVKSCQELPGQELFQYVNEQGERQAINSEDVNEYLRQISGSDFTAKDFRTWAGTVLAAMALRELERCDTKAQAKKNVVQAIEAVAERLGNTPSVCKKCYVHPEVIGAYLEGTLVETLKRRAQRHLAESLRHLPPEEAAVLAFLIERLEQEQQRQRDLKNPIPLLRRSIHRITRQRKPARPR